MLQKTRAVILHTIRYGESSLIVHTFTENWGRKAFLLKGVRKSRRSNRPNMYQPLFILDLDIYLKESRDLNWIKEAAFAFSSPRFYMDVTKSTQAIFLSEMLIKTLREEERNPEMFTFLVKTIIDLETANQASPSYHLLFLFQFSRYLGFYPMRNFSDDNVFFNTRAGAFTSFLPGTDIEKERIIGRLWKNAFLSDFQTIDQHIINKDERNLFLDSLLDYYNYHQLSIGEMKSLGVLRTVFE